MKSRTSATSVLQAGKTIEILETKHPRFEARSLRKLQRLDRPPEVARCWYPAVHLKRYLPQAPNGSRVRLGSSSRLQSFAPITSTVEVTRIGLADALHSCSIQGQKQEQNLLSWNNGTMYRSAVASAMAAKLAKPLAEEGFDGRGLAVLYRTTRDRYGRSKDDDGSGVPAVSIEGHSGSLIVPVAAAVVR